MAVNKTNDNSRTKPESAPTPPPAPAPVTAGARRIKYGLNVGVLMAALLFIIVALNWFAAANSARFDLTKSRRYSLSPQTTAILNSLDEPCTLTILFTEEDPTMSELQRDAIRSARTQVEDVLEEFQRRSDKITVRRIDPSNPSTLPRYQALIEDLRASRSDLIEKYETTIDEGKQEVDQLKAFINGELTRLADQLAQIDRSNPSWRDLRQIYGVLSTMPFTVDTIVGRVDSSLESGTRRPLPDWEGARSILIEALQEPASTFRAIARYFQETAKNEESQLPDSMKASLEPDAQRYEQMANELENMRDRLSDLEPINLSRIIRQISTGNCVLLSDATDTNVIPFNTLFPTPSVEQAQRRESLDRRFAGERVISAAIRRLTIKEQSTVVICHVEQGDLLGIRGNQQNQATISDAVQQLRDLGFDVKLWNVTQGERPEVKANQFAEPVWVIFPPPPDPQNPQQATQASQLADVASDLITSGQRVMMNFYPSTMVGFGQPDFWNDVIKPLHIEAKTGEVILQNFPGPNETSQTLPIVTVNQFETDTVIGAALNDLDTLFHYAVPILLPDELSGTENAGKDTSDQSADSGDEKLSTEEPASESENGKGEDVADPDDADDTGPVSDIACRVVANVEPTNLIWATDEWMNPNSRTLQPPAETPTRPYHVVVEVERGLKSGTQRVIVVGSGMWFTDGVVQQRALTDAGLLYLNPGNSELFRSGVCWLAGLDELIAPSPMAQTVSRIEGLDRGERKTYQIVLMLILPLAVLSVGIFVWFVRRG